MGNMPMFGGSTTMAMPWMRVPGQSWPGVAASFVGMWVVMMAGMMLPSLVPMLRRYRLAVDGTGQTAQGLLTAVVGAAYFAVWAVFGMAVFPLGVGISALHTQYPALIRAGPITVGFVILIAGFLQLTTWKARHLAYCSRAQGPSLPASARTAWRHGVRLGFHCIQCCVGLMAILLVSGVMNLGVMMLVAAAITVERIASGGERVARATGIAGVAVGLFLIVRTAGY